MYYGFAGKILFIDLIAGEIRSDELDLEEARKYLGGFGLSYKMAYDLSKPGADPLSPDNPLVFIAGTLCGTTVPGAVKTTAVTKLPLTETFGWSHGSMKFASMLKWAGYDGLVVTGKSDKPVTININDDKVEILDAGHLWGKDIFEATAEITKKNDQASVMCIGQAGEKLVKLSLAMIDITSTIGQGGLSAVMGSKNLKAIAVYGTKGINISDKRGFSKIVSGMKKRYMSFPHRETTLKLGMMAGWKDILLKHYVNTEHMTAEELTDVYGIDEYAKIKKKSIACPGCLVADKEVLETTGGRFSNLLLPAVSYAAIPSIAGLFKINDLSESAYLYDQCNRVGLSTQTLEGFLDFILLLYEDGIITKKDLGGLEAKRNFKTAKTLIEIITNREGVGDIFADGWQAVTASFGKECERHAFINKGINFIWDPRLFIMGTMEFAQITSPKGPYSAFGGSPTTIMDLEPDFFKRHCQRVGAGDDQINRIFDSPSEFNVARLSGCFENWVTILSTTGICNRAFNDRYYSAKLVAELYSTATGLDVDVPELVQAADRIWTVTRAINVREGITRKDDIIPEQWFKPIKTSDGKEHIMRDYYKKKVLERGDIEQLLNDYYTERGWDEKKGIPESGRLNELGLGKIDKDMDKYR